MPNMFFVCVFNSFFFFFNDTATTEIYTLSLHDALPISLRLAQDEAAVDVRAEWRYYDSYVALVEPSLRAALDAWIARSEEHTSELQSQSNLVCRLLLEKKNNTPNQQRVSCQLHWTYSSC